MVKRRYVVAGVSVFMVLLALIIITAALFPVFGQYDIRSVLNHVRHVSLPMTPWRDFIHPARMG